MIDHIRGGHCQLPERFSSRQAAAVGTAGYTAALCVLALERGGLGAGAEVVVTGAAGGVGTIALLLGLILVVLPRRLDH